MTRAQREATQNDPAESKREDDEEAARRYPLTAGWITLVLGLQLIKHGVAGSCRADILVLRALYL